MLIQFSSNQKNPLIRSMDGTGFINYHPKARVAYLGPMKTKSLAIWIKSLRAIAGVLTVAALVSLDYTASAAIGRRLPQQPCAAAAAPYYAPPVDMGVVFSAMAR